MNLLEAKNTTLFSEPSGAQVLLCFFLLVYGVTLCFLKVAAFQHGFAHADLTLYQNILWNTNFQGNLLYSDFFFHEFGYNSYLVEHFSPTLLLLAPFYQVWNSPYLLLLLQGLTPVATALLFYAYSQKLNLPKNVAIITIVSWCVHPTVVMGVLDIGNGFHHDSLIPPFLLLSLLLYQQPRHLVFYLALFFTLGLKENVPLIVLVAAAVAFITKTNRKRAIASALMAMAFLYIGFSVVPEIYGVKPHHASGIIDSALNKGMSIDSVLTTLVANKELFWHASALLSPLYLVIAIPELAIYHYSSYETYIFDWHGLPSITIVVVAAMHGFRQWQKMTVKFNRDTMTKIFLAYLIGLVLMGATYSIAKSRTLIQNVVLKERLVSTEDVDYFREVLLSVPENAKLGVQYLYGPIAANRQHLLISEHSWQAEYLFIDIETLHTEMDAPLMQLLCQHIEESQLHTLVQKDSRFFLFKVSSQFNHEKPENFFEPLSSSQFEAAKQCIKTSGTTPVKR